MSLDELVEQITVDAYGDEGYWSFRQAFEDHVEFPVLVSVVGTENTVPVARQGKAGSDRHGGNPAIGFVVFGPEAVSGSDTPGAEVDVGVGDIWQRGNGTGSGDQTI